ncbi:MAG: hypothetical protein Q9212_004527 [Teloschistes hypoglaucus]
MSFLAIILVAIAVTEFYYNVLRPSNGRPETETVPEPRPAAKNPQPKPVVTAPKPHGEKSKVINVVPEPKAGERKQPESKNPLPESKPEGKKAKSINIPPESPPQGYKPNSNPVAPKPKPEGKKVTLICCGPGLLLKGGQPKPSHTAPQPIPDGKKFKTTFYGPELKPQADKRKLNDPAPSPKPEDKKFKWTYHWCGTEPTPQGEKRKLNHPAQSPKPEGKKVKWTFPWCWTEPAPQGEKRKLNHPAPSPKPEGKKVKWTFPWCWTEPTPQDEKRKSVSAVPEPKPEGKKIKTTHPVTESKGQGGKRKASPIVPEPKHEGKKAKQTPIVTESKGQGENPKSNLMAPTPKRGGKKVKSKADHWTGGPALARHIPWPKIFKNHLSNLEGHFRMLEMIRKHTKEGSGNYRTVSEMIDRTNEILRTSKTAARAFVPAADQLDKAPLGSSSDSMYPDSSPNDIECGKASEENGKYATDAKKKGIETKPEDAQYKVGQSKIHSQLTLAQMQALKDFQDGAKSSPAKDANGTSSEAKKTGHKGKGQGSAKASSKDANPVFFTDTKPTPVNLPSSSKEQKPSAKKEDDKKSKYVYDIHKSTPTRNADGLFPPNPSALFQPRTDGPSIYGPYGPPPQGDPYLIPIQEDEEKEVNRKMAIRAIKERIRDQQLDAEWERRKNPKKRKQESDLSFDSFLNPASNEQPKGKKVRIVADKGTKAGVDAPKKRAADDVTGEKKSKKTKDTKDAKDAKDEGDEKPVKKRKEKDGEGNKAKDGKVDEEGKPVKKRKGKDGEGKVVADAQAKDERLVDTDVPDDAESKKEKKKKRRVAFA